MRFARAYVLASLFFPILLLAQQTPTPTPQSSPQALTLLKQSLATLTGGKSIVDITLSGTAHRIVGPDDESGTATFKALVGTGSRLDLTLPSGNSSEVRNVSGGNLTGSWTGPDGVSHPIAYQNLFTDSGLFPALTLASFFISTGAVVNYIGAETKNGASVAHLSAYQLPPHISGDLPRHLSQVDFFLDSTTNLPLFLDFSIHPDNNALLDIPIEIQFSGYQLVNGAQVPLHVQKFVNNSLLLDLQFTAAQCNSGTPAAVFNVQ